MSFFGGVALRHEEDLVFEVEIPQVKSRLLAVCKQVLGGCPGRAHWYAATEGKWLLRGAPLHVTGSGMFAYFS